MRQVQGKLSCSTNSAEHSCCSATLTRVHSETSDIHTLTRLLSRYTCFRPLGVVLNARLTIFHFSHIIHIKESPTPLFNLISANKIMLYKQGSNHITNAQHRVRSIPCDQRLKLNPTGNPSSSALKNAHH